VIVEGVETRAELQLLRDMGHRFMQGYLLSRPLAPEALVDRLPADDAGTGAGHPANAVGTVPAVEPRGPRGGAA
jgi:predicted signal transduction protein with EAL and GGDEF domain